MNTLLFPLIRKLNDQRFHSGEDLAAEYSVSRGTVNNLIQQAKEMGLEIHAVRGRGYRLARTCEWLDTDALRKRLARSHKALKVEVVEEIDSTNSRLLDQLRLGDPPSVLCAEYQTGGRGRRGREWAAAPAGSLIFSLSWRFERPVGELGGLSLASGLALVRALSRHTRHTLQLKWPNDILSGFRKLAGVLVEIQGEASGPSGAVIGVGVNLLLPKALRSDIGQGVVDMDELGRTTDRTSMLADCLDELIPMMKRFDQAGFSPMAKEWSRWHAYQNKEVNLMLPGGKREIGRVEGVDASGALLINQGSGPLQRYSSGEVSLRPHHARRAAR